MGYEVKYEKIDSNNLRKWTKADDLLNKQELSDLRIDYNFIVNMSDEILGRIYNGNITLFKEGFQTKIDEIDAILDLLNNTVTTENIDFADEE